MGRDGEAGPAEPGPYDELAGRDSCADALDTLYWYLDGELTPERRVTIRHHLEECGPCLEAYDFEVELKAVIAKRCRDQVPDSLRRRVAEALAQASSGGRSAPPSGERASGEP